MLFLVPDEVQPSVYDEHIGPHLRPGSALVFASGYNLTFDPIVPPAEVDVLLFTPKMIGNAVRRLYVAGKGVRQLRLGGARCQRPGLAVTVGVGKGGRVAAPRRAADQRPGRSPFGPVR